MSNRKINAVKIISFLIIFIVLLAQFIAGCESEEEKIFKKLLRGMKSEYPEIRDNAASSLGNIKDPRAVGPLSTALFDRDVKVRLSAATSLGLIGDIKAIEPLKATAFKTDENPQVRWWAITSLGMLNNPKVISSLINILMHEEDTTLKSAAASALGNMRHPNAVEALDQALSHENTSVRRHAIVALGQIGEPAISPIIKALKDQDKLVRLSATSSLERIGNPQVIQALETVLGDPDETIRKTAQRAIAKLREKQ